MELITKLLDLHPQSLLIANKRDHNKFWRLRGSTPLECIKHFAEDDNRHEIVSRMCKHISDRPCFQSGRLLLHEAIDQPLSLEIMQKVLNAAPYMVSRRDPKTKLYPFMQAATQATENSRIDMIFELLRTDPSLLISATRRKLVGVPTTTTTAIAYPKVESQRRRKGRVRSLMMKS